ncbi:rod shape-determining protein MreD [Rhodohalobacter sp. SW132]|uniref:rod shape-determining protein MreD n=1 Tax=Rhodohalobacter sp. SW132 TaxID=2293433 RepID=UPI000E2411D0|nr:rod shape-determining protein MreD [Rhodohalobacter sp. SW132]REL33111.1 rod shape-determining protein MreD [Rhodohalobacter sp. SW132]
MIRSDVVRFLLFGLGAVFIQVVLLRHLTIFNAQSDLVLIFVLWLCTKRSKTEAILITGFVAFFQDALTDLWGVNLFSKVLTVFILHNFLNRTSENSFLVWQIFLIIAGASLLHNLFFYIVSSLSGLYASEYVVVSLLIVSTLFTALLGGFLHLVRSR